MKTSRNLGFDKKGCTLILKSVSYVNRVSEFGKRK